MPDSLLLARQPIFDRSLNIAAYELLFRSDAGTVLKDSDANLATTQVLLNAFTDLDIDALLEDHKAYVNFTRDLILHPPPFNKDKYVIEVLESIHIDDELVQQLRRLKRRGYTIALDDFEYSKDWDAVLKLADIVKLDVLAMSREQLIAAVDRMKTYGVKLLAEKVESHEMFHFCCDLGFQLFQGYFLCRPRPIRGNRISRPQLAAQSLLSAIQNPELEIEHLSSLVAGDSVMSAGVLRIENASNGGDVEHAMVDSAIATLNTQQLRNWITLLSYQVMPDKPMALFISAISRARMCQQLALAFADEAGAHRYFSVGLLSNIDAYLDRPLKEIIPTMPLEKDIGDALLFGHGPMGMILRTAIASERAMWNSIDWEILKEKCLTPSDVEGAYIDSIQWAGSIAGAIQSGQNA